MYNKIFTQILDSSIWLESNPTRIVWLTLLITMDETGYAHFAALANLAGRARVTLDEAKIAVDCLENPDSNSSDPEFEGRRIERVPGGWLVLNSKKYKEIISRAVNQERTRLRMVKFRERQQSPSRNVTERHINKSDEKVTLSETATPTPILRPVGRGRAAFWEDEEEAWEDRFSKKLHQLLYQKGRVTNQPSLKEWATALRSWRQKSSVSKEKVVATGRWLEENISKKYTPVVFSMATFLGKFGQLQAAMQRDRGTSADSALPSDNEQARILREAGQA